MFYLQPIHSFYKTNIVVYNYRINQLLNYIEQQIIRVNFSLHKSRTMQKIK